MWIMKPTSRSQVWRERKRVRVRDRDIDEDKYLKKQGKFKSGGNSRDRGNAKKGRERWTYQESLRK